MRPALSESIVLIAVLCSASGCSVGPAETTADRRERLESTDLRDVLDYARLGLDPDTASLDDVLALLRASRKETPRPAPWPGSEADPVGHAEQLIARGYLVRDHAPLSLVPPIDWSDYPDGDGNWHYKVNSLAPLTTIILAYIESGEPSYAGLAYDLTFDWIDFNIVRNEDNEKKWHDMATALRADKLAFLVDDAIRKGTLSTPRLGLLLRSLQLHAEFLRDPENLSEHNHGVFMMMGLESVCSTIPELIDAVEHCRYARQELERLVKSQFSSEGIHLEGAPGYQLFITKTLASLSRSGTIRDGDEVHRVYEQARRQLTWMFHPNGEIVQIGDTSADLAERYRPLSPTLDYIMSDGGAGERPGRAWNAFPEAGYAVFRSPWYEHPFDEHSFLFFSAASHRSKHSHYDDFTFEWSHRGVPVVVDSGKYTYIRGEERAFFASTRAGNTVEIDGENHERLPTLSALRDWGESEGLYFAEAAVDRPRIDVRHVRRVVMDPDEWLCVVDTLEAKEDHTYRQWFGFHEALEVESDGNGLVVRDPATTTRIDVRDLSPELSDVVLVRGVEGERMQGWISRKYGEKSPRYSAAFVKEGSSVTFATLFSAAGEASPAGVVRRTDGSIDVHWRSAEGAVRGFVLTSDERKGGARLRVVR